MTRLTCTISLNTCESSIPSTNAFARSRFAGVAKDVIQMLRWVLEPILIVNDECPAADAGAKLEHFPIILGRIQS